jgi:putative sterol carrier protein
MQPRTIKEFFQQLPDQLDQDAAEDLSAVYQFDLSGTDGGQYCLIVQDGGCAVHEGRHPDPQVTFEMSGEDCLKILNGKLEGPAVFMSGRLRVEGDFGLAMQLKSLFPSVR